jgi:hypothetical protein
VYEPAALPPHVQRGQVPGGHAYTCSVHKDAAGRIVLEHWEVHGAGHAWCCSAAAFRGLRERIRAREIAAAPGKVGSGSLVTRGR